MFPMQEIFALIKNVRARTSMTGFSNFDISLLRAVIATAIRTTARDNNSIMISTAVEIGAFVCRHGGEDIGRKL